LRGAHPAGRLSRISADETRDDRNGVARIDRYSVRRAGTGRPGARAHRQDMSCTVATTPRH